MPQHTRRTMRELLIDPRSSLSRMGLFINRLGLFFLAAAKPKIWQQQKFKLIQKASVTPQRLNCHSPCSGRGIGRKKGWRGRPSAEPGWRRWHWSSPSRQAWSCTVQTYTGRRQRTAWLQNKRKRLWLGVAFWRKVAENIIVSSNHWPTRRSHSIAATSWVSSKALEKRTEKPKVREINSGGHSEIHVEHIYRPTNSLYNTISVTYHYWIRIRRFLRKNPQLDAADEGPEQSHHAKELDAAQVLHCVLLAQVGYSI